MRREFHTRTRPIRVPLEISEGHWIKVAGNPVASGGKGQAFEHVTQQNRARCADLPPSVR
jgi:hypothetical protein